jgi:hypothetical protein
MTITATVVFIPIEGGFYGLETADGQKYNPDQPLPPEFCHHGLQVRAEIERSSGFSVRMWGKLVTVRSITKI